MQTVSEKGDEDVRFDARGILMEDGTNRQIAFEVLERLLDRDQLQIVAPQLGRIGLGEVGAQQVAAFAPAHLSELV